MGTGSARLCSVPYRAPGESRPGRRRRHAVTSSPISIRLLWTTPAASLEGSSTAKISRTSSRRETGDARLYAADGRQLRSGLDAHPGLAADPPRRIQAPGPLGGLAGSPYLSLR